MSIQLVGINHATAPVALREQLAFDDAQTRDAHRQLMSQLTLEESMVLSTCNRSEIYCIADQPVQTSLTGWLCQFHAIERDRIEPHLYYHADDAAVMHLFRVASGLDSMVLGEPEILGQVKSAYQLAREHETTGYRLNMLLESSFSAAKHARSETSIGVGSISVAATGVKLARQVFSDLGQQTALLIGAGETIELTARHLRKQGIGHLIIANRTYEKAHALAEEVSGAAIELEDLESWLDQADLIFSSTAASNVLITLEQMTEAIKRRRHKPVLMVDLAVPRDIDERINSLEDVFLFTLDHIQDLARQTEDDRIQASQQAEILLEQHLAKFMRWLRDERSRQAISAIRQNTESIRDRLLAEAVRKLEQGQPPGDTLELLANRLTKQILHHPTRRIRDALEKDEHDLLDAALKLFIEKEERK